MKIWNYYTTRTLQIGSLLLLGLGIYNFADSAYQWDISLKNEMAAQDVFMFTETGKACCFEDYQAYQKLNNFTKFQEMEQLQQPYLDQQRQANARTGLSFPLIMLPALALMIIGIAIDTPEKPTKTKRFNSREWQ